jgi:hypothetical protein
VKQAESVAPLLSWLDGHDQVKELERLLSKAGSLKALQGKVSQADSARPYPSTTYRLEPPDELENSFEDIDLLWVPQKRSQAAHRPIPSKRPRTTAAFNQAQQQPQGPWPWTTTGPLGSDAHLSGQGRTFLDDGDELLQSTARDRGRERAEPLQLQPSGPAAADLQITEANSRSYPIALRLTDGWQTQPIAAGMGKVLLEELLRHISGSDERVRQWERMPVLKEVCILSKVISKQGKAVSTTATKQSRPAGDA